MGWSSLAAAVTALRTQLSDGPTDKYCSRKKVFGTLDGSNTIYKSFEPRRITNFTSATAPQGVYLGNTLQTVSSDDIESGEFVLAAAPADNGTALTASYYYQWYTDLELQQFLSNGSNWLGLGSDPTLADNGLQPAILNFAAADALKKLAMRMSVRISSTFMLEDAPKKEAMDAVTSFVALANGLAKDAEKYRDNFYTRQGQSSQPLFATVGGCVRPTVPRR